MAAQLPKHSCWSTYVRTQVGLPPSMLSAQTLSKEARALIAGKPDWNGKPFGVQAVLDAKLWTEREKDFDPVARLRRKLLRGSM